MELLWILFGCIILLAYTLEAVTGFGSIVIALSLGVLFLPFDKILPILVALNICMTSMLAFKITANRHFARHVIGHVGGIFCETLF